MAFSRAQLALLSILLATTGCSVDPTPLSGSTIYATCLSTDVPIETEISIAGVFEGGAFPEGQIRSADAPTLVALKADAGGAPQIYVVSASSPVIWDFADVPAERIRGVIAYGDDRQVVRNTPSAVPIAHGSYEAGNGQDAVPPTSAECGGSHSVYHGGPRLDALVAEVEGGTGVKVKRFRSAYAPTSLNFDADQPGDEALIASSPMARTPRDRIDDGVGAADNAPGFERLQPLIGQGLLRQATADDVRAWEGAASAGLASSARMAAPTSPPTWLAMAVK